MPVINEYTASGEPFSPSISKTSTNNIKMLPQKLSGPNENSLPTPGHNRQSSCSSLERGDFLQSTPVELTRSRISPCHCLSHRQAEQQGQDMHGIAKHGLQAPYPPAAPSHHKWRCQQSLTNITTNIQTSTSIF